MGQGSGKGLKFDGAHCAPHVPSYVTAGCNHATVSSFRHAQLNCSLTPSKQSVNDNCTSVSSNKLFLFGAVWRHQSVDDVFEVFADKFCGMQLLRLIIFFSIIFYAFGKERTLLDILMGEIIILGTG